MESALRPDDLSPEEYDPEPEPTTWSMPEREPADLTDFVELPLFASAAATPGNGASPEPSPDEPGAATPEPSPVTPAGRNGGDAEAGQQLRLL